jgi:hypothetical protein
MEGYVYAWKVPVGVRATVDRKEMVFFIVKVGQSGRSTVLQRLRTEKTAWRKLMAKKSPGKVIYKYDRDVDIPAGTALLAEHILLSKKASWERLCDHHDSELSDLGFLIHCSEDQGSNLNDTETLARSLLGPPFPTDVLKTAIDTYNRIERKNRPSTGTIDRSQIAPTEYCLVESGLFFETRRRFLEMSKGTRPFGSIPFQDVLKLLTAGRADCPYACRLDVSSFLRLPRSYELPMVVVRAHLSAPHSSKGKGTDRASQAKKDIANDPDADSTGGADPLRWSRSELVDFFLERCKPRGHPRFCMDHDIYLTTLKRYTEYEKYPWSDSQTTKIALANFANECLDET